MTQSEFEKAVLDYSEKAYPLLENKWVFAFSLLATVLDEGQREFVVNHIAKMSETNPNLK